MIKNVKELVALAKSKGLRKIAVVNADDLDVLTSLRQAARENIVLPVLFGNAKNIEKKLNDNGFIYEREIVDCKTDEECAERAVKMISKGDAHMLMKGLVTSATFMRAALNKEWGLSNSKLLSHITLVIPERTGKAFLLTDAGINIAPDLMEKKVIAENAVEVAYRLGIDIPIVVPVCAVETVNPKMPATVDAAILSKMSERGQIKRCIIDGPLALDNAISLEAAKHKKISSAGAGLADIILAPNIESGNIIYKALAYLAHTQMAAMVVGAKVPMVLTSRADSPETKYNSIVFASAVS
jgi:phosphate butyryltransferase